MDFPVPANEQRRLEALRLHGILDSEPEAAFDDIALIASEAVGAPVALVSLIDEHRQWYKAKVGTAASEVPRHETFCTHALLGDDVMVVEDATRDPRFAANPHVTRDGGVRFYAGAPIVDSQGLALGSVCVVGPQARGLTPSQHRLLLALARTTMRLLEQRRTARLLAEALAEVKTVQGLLPICSSCKSIRAEEGYWTQVEEYFSTRTDALFSHGICPDCMQRLYPEIFAKLKGEGKI